MSIILGSQSQSRKKILEYFSLPFQQVPSHFEESSVVYDGDPKKYAAALAFHKNQTLAPLYPGQVIVTADTVVFCEGKIYNKPESQAEAVHFLETFSNRWQSVFTAVVVQKDLTFHTDVEETKLLFNPLSLSQIQKFHSTFLFANNAGGYAIEKSGSLIISKLEGSYDNVLGLPVNALQKLLLHVGIDLWDYLKPHSCA